MRFSIGFGRNSDEGRRSYTRPVLVRLGRALRWRVLGSSRGRLRPMWTTLFEAAIQVVSTYLVRGEKGATVYVRGSFGRRDVEFGLSDVDLAVVVDEDSGRPGAARLRTRRRWERLAGVLPAVAREIDLAVYESAELSSAAAASTLTTNGAVYFGSASPADEAKVRHRPGLAGTLSGWRRIRGVDRPIPARGPHEERLAAWLELQFWWRVAIAACTGPRGVSGAYTSVKLLAEAARIWLWVARGEQAADRRGALRLAARRLPEEEGAFRLALELLEALDRTTPARLDEVLPAFSRLSGRVADEIFGQSAAVDHIRVGVHWDGPGELALASGAQAGLERLLGREPELLPLADWRAVVVSPAPDEAFALLPFDRVDPDIVAASAAAAGPGCAGVVLDGDLLVRPVHAGGGVLRSVQCRATDPVSFALLEGANHAEFPSIPGLAATDWARRATAEHRAWLDAAGDLRAQPLKALGRQITAARAALFQASLEDGDPQLALTVGATAAAVVEAKPSARTVVEEAVGSYSACLREGRDPAPGVVGALRGVVNELPAYARGRSRDAGFAEVRA